MNNTRSSRLILNEMERLESLSGQELKNYIKELRDALYHERKATNAREFRLREKLNAVTKAVTETVTEAVTSTKEERSEKENLPPTPPLREKGKKEENAHPSGVRAARAHAREDVPDLAEVEETFKTICRNRYCNPVRKWSIHDIAKRKKISLQSAERQYYKHFKRLLEIFGVSQVGY